MLDRTPGTAPFHSVRSNRQSQWQISNAAGYRVPDQVRDDMVSEGTTFAPIYPVIPGFIPEIQCCASQGLPP